MLVVSASLGDGGADVEVDDLKLRRDKNVSICYNISTNRRIRQLRIHALFYVPGPPDFDILAFFQSSVDALPFARDTSHGHHLHERRTARARYGADAPRPAVRRGHAEPRCTHGAALLTLYTHPSQLPTKLTEACVRHASRISAHTHV